MYCVVTGVDTGINIFRSLKKKHDSMTLYLFLNVVEGLVYSFEEKISSDNLRAVIEKFLSSLCSFHLFWTSYIKKCSQK